MVLGDDWCRTFKRMEGGGQETIIWSWLRKRRRGNFSFLVVEKLSFDSTCYEVWHLFGFGLYLVEDKSPFRLSFSWTWRLIFRCGKNVRKELRGLKFAF
jgi:hypothetical protein